MTNTIINSKISMLADKDNCFGAIRYYMAFVVLFSHFAELSGTAYHWINNSAEAVQGFFILSGFLVFYSFLKRPTLKTYALKRIRRMFPPYFFIIILCCIGGAFITNLPIKEYFFSLHFVKYVAANFTFLNFLEPTLPGVFTANPMPSVNGALWTIKVELMLYASVPVVYYMMRRYNRIVVLMCVFAISVAYREAFGWLYEQSGSEIYKIMQRQVGTQFVYFYSGTAIFVFFDYFQRYIRYILPIALICYIFSRFSTVVYYVEPLCFASLIIGVAYNLRYLNFIGRHDNISYGIYLFHVPVIQTIVHFQIPQYNYYLALSLTVIITVLLASISWKYIEKPIITRH